MVARMSTGTAPGGARTRSPRDPLDELAANFEWCVIQLATPRVILADEAPRFRMVSVLSESTEVVELRVDDQVVVPPATETRGRWCVLERDAGPGSEVVAVAQTRSGRPRIALLVVTDQER